MVREIKLVLSIFDDIPQEPSQSNSPYTNPHKHGVWLFIARYLPLYNQRPGQLLNGKTAEAQFLRELLHLSRR